MSFNLATFISYATNFVLNTYLWLCSMRDIFYIISNILSVFDILMRSHLSGLMIIHLSGHMLGNQL